MYIVVPPLASSSPTLFTSQWTWLIGEFPSWRRRSLQLDIILQYLECEFMKYVIISLQSTLISTGTRLYSFASRSPWISAISSVSLVFVKNVVHVYPSTQSSFPFLKTLVQPPLPLLLIYESFVVSLNPFVWGGPYILGTVRELSYFFSLF